MSQMREYLQNNKIITDGAFGTYFSREDILPEKANIEAPELVSEIHKAYLEAGANFIRTNSFASNTEGLSCDREGLFQNLQAAVSIARNTIKEFQNQNDSTSVFLAGDIGPIPAHDSFQSDQIKDEYYFIAKTFAENGVDALVFETFSNFDDIEDAIRRIKTEYPEIFVVTQFSVNQMGYTNAGLSARAIVTEANKLVKETKCIDAMGFNCGVGPGHLYQIMKGLPFTEDYFVTALPNASYPKLVQNRVVFSENIDYFAEKMCDLAKTGVDILGGCCGTNPAYIRKLSERLSNTDFSLGKEIRKENRISKEEFVKSQSESVPMGAFYGEKNRKLIAVELSPPINANDTKIMEAAHMLEDLEVDVVTFPDSPSGRTRADSVLIAAKIARETGLKVMPHICCRDKNAIAIHSQFLGAYVNGVRNALLITGDPVPTMIRSNVKSVFNFDAVGLMKILNEMNEDEFSSDPMVFGGAINQTRLNLDVEIKRVKRKMEAGATFFFSQPVFCKEDMARIRQIKEETGARILCGIMPLISLKNASFMKNEMTGIHVTDEIISMFKEDMTKEQGEAVGVAIAKMVMEETKDYVDGYYFSIPFNRVYLLKDICDNE